MNEKLIKITDSVNLKITTPNKDGYKDGYIYKYLEFRDSKNLKTLANVIIQNCPDGTVYFRVDMSRKL